LIPSQVDSFLTSSLAPPVSLNVLLFLFEGLISAQAFLCIFSFSPSVAVSHSFLVVNVFGPLLFFLTRSYFKIFFPWSHFFILQFISFPLKGIPFCADLPLFAHPFKDVLVDVS